MAPAVFLAALRFPTSRLGTKLPPLGVSERCVRRTVENVSSESLYFSHRETHAQQWGKRKVRLHSFLGVVLRPRNRGEGRRASHRHEASLESAPSAAPWLLLRRSRVFGSVRRTAVLVYSRRKIHTCECPGGRASLVRAPPVPPPGYPRFIPVPTMEVSPCYES